MTALTGIRAGTTAVAAGAAAWALVDRPWLRGGATRAEARAALPGDEVVAPADLRATRAVTIAAPPARVWPWIVQMGYGRAGWYAFDGVDNGGAPSADAIVPELQDLSVGDVLQDATGPFGFRVTVLQPPRLLVLRTTIHPITGRHVDPGDRDGRAFLDLSWAFVLQPTGDGGTRLLVRVRYRRTPRWWVRAMVNGFEVADAISARRMLAGIRERAERAASCRANDTPAPRGGATGRGAADAAGAGTDGRAVIPSPSRRSSPR